MKIVSHPLHKEGEHGIWCVRDPGLLDGVGESRHHLKDEKQNSVMLEQDNWCT